MAKSKQTGGGCMAGFFNFSNLLTGKRFYLKRLPPPIPSSDVSANSTSEVVGSPEVKEQSEKFQYNQSPEPELRKLDPATVEVPKSNVSPWKFVREAPRLSLDSRLRPRVNTAGDGDEERENQRRSPCVIARLMGLEQTESSSESQEKKVELRRSASESRSRDYPFLPNPSFLEERKSDQLEVSRTSNIKLNLKKSNPNPNPNPNPNQNHDYQRRLTAERKKSSYYNTADFFPQKQQQQGLTIYGEIENRLRSKNTEDLETLKHILEALQLKGLLHSSIATPPLSRRNRDSPIVVIAPASVSPRRERSSRNTRRSDNRSSSPPVRRKGGPLSVETQRRSDSPVQSPKMARSDRTMNRSPRGRRSTVAGNRRERLCRRGSVDDEASTISESSFTTSSHTENEKWRGEECNRGGSLLERCDKLLHSIAEMNLNSNTNSAELQQPSPVSVLDSSFYKDEESSPSPVKKRSIHFKGLEDQLWSPPSPSSSSSSSSSYPDHHHHTIDSSSLDDPDFIYISKLFKASNYLPNEPHLFLLLEKQISKEENAKVSSLHRKVIFDTITEILNRTRNFPPRKPGPERLSLGHIWAEFKRIRELGPAQDLIEVIIEVLKKDLAQDSVAGWRDCQVEISEAVLDIERLIFKDLIGESIEDLAAIATKCMGAEKYCRKLVF